jgi:hypothetical protein
MGCDIHCYAEVKKGQKWVKVGRVFVNPYYDEKRKDKWNKPKTDQPYQGRNYNLFGILADVRNGRGVAGCDLGDGFVPIDSPRGIPNDVSDSVQGLFNGWGGDAHSDSYFTLEELLRYDWQQKSNLRGVVNEKEYIEWAKNGRGEPQGYCGDVGGPNIVKVTNAEMDLIASAKKVVDCTKDYYTQVQWVETYAEAAGKDFFMNTLPALAKLGKADKVRIVFWFDN